VTRQSTIGLSRRRCTAGLAVSVTANPWTSGFAAAGPASGGVGAERRPASPAAAWLTLPPTPSLPKTENEGIVDVNGTKIFFAQFGRGPHVLFLHGGYANSNYWGHQIDALSSRFAITAMDTRGHGRSPLSSRRFGYDVFAGDAASLLDRLEIKKTWVVGWSDGAITGLLLTIIMPDRIAGVFAFGANSTSDGIKPGGSRSMVFSEFTARAAREYRLLSANPGDWQALVSCLTDMWRTQPNLSANLLAMAKPPITIADGDHDEIIRLVHAEYLAKAIPGAKLLIQPDVSHFAMLQRPETFSAALSEFLEPALVAPHHVQGRIHQGTAAGVAEDPGSQPSPAPSPNGGP
jgi:pimeloyl-ACP methyl ester carboxylesterase